MVEVKLIPFQVRNNETSRAVIYMLMRCMGCIEGGLEGNADLSGGGIEMGTATGDSGGENVSGG